MFSCQQCGSDFHRNRARRLMFCGRRCAGLAREARARLDRGGKRCPVCTVTFWPPIGAARRDAQRCCSNACAASLRTPGPVNPQKAVGQECCRWIARALRHKGRRDVSAIVDAMGWSPLELRSHLEAAFEPGMGWENYGRGGWHVDHITEVFTFPIGTPIRTINALTNLRPLWERENCSRKPARWRMAA